MVLCCPACPAVMPAAAPAAARQAPEGLKRFAPLQRSSKLILYRRADTHSLRRNNVEPLRPVQEGIRELSKTCHKGQGPRCSKPRRKPVSEGLRAWRPPPRPGCAHDGRQLPIREVHWFIELLSAPSHKGRSNVRLNENHSDWPLRFRDF